MTNQELEEVQKTYHTDLSNIHELTVSVQENQLQGILFRKKSSTS